VQPILHLQKFWVAPSCGTKYYCIGYSTAHVPQISA